MTVVKRDALPDCTATPSFDSVWKLHEFAHPPAPPTKTATQPSAEAVTFASADDVEASARAAAKAMQIVLPANVHPTQNVTSGVLHLHPVLAG